MIVPDPKDVNRQWCCC